MRYRVVSEENSKCPFCKSALNDSGGCEHVLYTYATCNGLMAMDNFVYDVVQSYKERLLAKERKDDPEMDIEDVEVDDDKLLRVINREINKKFSKAVMIKIHAVWGSTARYVVAKS